MDAIKTPLWYCLIEFIQENIGQLHLHGAHLVLNYGFFQ